MNLKRVLSMVLCLCMLLSCIPAMGAFAETAAAEELVTAATEQTVRIEAENAAWNIYADPNSANENASGTMVGGAPGTPTYPSWDDADSTEDLLNGFIDKSNDPYVVFYVDAPAAGSYKLKTAGLFRLNTANDNAYAAILVNPSRKIEDPSATVAYQAYYGSVGTAGVYMVTEAVEVQLVEGRNVIFVTPLTYEQDVKWANVDYLDISGAYAVEQTAVNVQTLYAGDAPYTYGYTTKNAGGSIGGGNWGGLGSKTLAISDMSAANADKLRSFAYTVNAPEDGYYDLTVSFNSMTAGDDAKAIGVLVDGVAQAREFAFNAGGNKVKGYIDLSVYLTEGDHVLTITAPANRTSAETANNSDWCDYAELVLYGGLTQSVIQSNPKMEWWYAEAEYVEQGYAVSHNLPNIETGHNNTFRDYNNANYSAYQSKCAMGGGSAANNYTLAQLQEGRLDKATTTGVSIYVEAEEAGSYDFYAYYRLNCPGVYGTTTPYGVFMVNGEFGAQAMFNAGGSDWSYNTDTVQLSLEKGLNEITFIPLTKDQYVSATDWASVDCIFVDTDLQVKKVPTGSVTVNPVQGTYYMFGQKNDEGTLLEYGVKDLAETDGLTAENLTRADLHKLAFTAYTVDAPYDGYYNISVVHTSKGDNTPENYGFGLLVDDRPSEVKHITSNNATSDISTYLTAGTHTLTVTNLLPLNSSVKGVHWTNLGQVTLCGGLTLADEQINPLTVGMSVMEAETDAYYNFTGMEKEYTKVEDSWLASGGKVVGGANASTLTYDQLMEHLSTDGQPYVEYVVEAAEAGEYELKISLVSSFASGAEKYYLMQVNGEMIRVDAPPQGTKVVAYCVPVTVNLVKGRNVIRVLSGNLSQTASTWINQDYLAVPEGVTPCAPTGRTVVQADRAANVGNYNYKTGDGRYWDSDGLNNVIVSELTLAELNESNFLDTSWYSVTVEAPADGYYPVQARVWIPAVETAQLGHIGMIANGETYQANLWQDSSSCATAEAIVYLSKGVNDLVITGILADSNVAADGNSIYWMDADFAWICGGLQSADTQRYPVQGLIPGSVYTEENGTVTVPAGTTDEEIKSNFYNGDMAGYTVVYDDTKTVKSVGASQILALGNPVGRVLNYRNAIFMESSASGFTLSGELEGDVKLTVRAEKGTSNGGIACLYVEIDGVVSEFAFDVGAMQEITIAAGLAKGEHTIKVTKGTDAKYDMIYVYSASYTGTLTQTAAADMGIEFIGDSISVGYGLYDADLSNKNVMSGSYYSYANVAADILGADHYVIGNGAWRFGENTGAAGDTRYLGYIYEKNSMNLNLGAYDFAWQPDVIVINLGTNDANQYTFTGTEADQEIWSADMAALLTMVRKHNPNAQIFWAYGAMEDVTTNATKDVVVPLIQNAIAAYNTANGDNVTYVHVTNDNTGVYDHPTREGHVVIGEEIALAISGVTTSRLEAESDSIYWRYTAVEAGAVSNAVGGVQPGNVANMQSYEALVGGAELKKTEHPMMSFIVDVKTEGDYTLDVAYRAGLKTGTINDYFIVVGVDDESYTKTSYVGAHPDNDKWSLGQATVHLTAGRHTIRFITMVSDTMCDTLYTNWINIDYVDVTGGNKVTAVAPEWTHLPSGDATYYNKFSTPNSTWLAGKAEEKGYALKSWWNGVLGGYSGDGSVISNGITTENFTIYELAKLGYFSYTVEVPADGFYDLQTYILCGNSDTFKSFSNKRNGHIMLAVDGAVNWFPAEFGYCELNWNAQNLPVYLTEGTHVLTVSGIIGDLGTCSQDWCDMGALSVSGGITLAETQIDPLSLIAKVDEIYVDADNGSDIAAGSADAPVRTLAKAFERINDGGIIHLVGTVPGTKGLPKFSGTVTITGDTLDLSAFEKVWMNSGIIFDDVTLNFMEDGSLFANGYHLTIKENVTVQNHISLYGGNYNADVANTEMYIYTGDYNVIYGGGYWSDISGTAKLVVGGNVNQGWGESTVLNHDSGLDIFGGSYDAVVNKTDVTFEGNALVRIIYAGGKNGVSVTNDTSITVTGGKSVGVYGGGASGSKVGNTNVVVTGGVHEQVYGGAETATVTGDVHITVTGGEITRRLAGGSYNGDIAGTVYMILGEGLNYSRSYTKSGIPVSEDITARCRTGSAAKAYLFFNSEAALTALSGELTDDPADNWGVLDIKSWNLILHDNIGMNFQIAVGEGIRDIVTITVDGVEAEYALEGNYYVIKNQKAAAQMTDEINITLKVGDVVIESNTYSVRQYADYILNPDNGYDAKTVALVKEMLNYGAAAQNHFGYNTEDSAIAGLDMTGVGSLAVPESAETDLSVSGSADGIRFYGASLVFESKVAVRFYFTGSSEGIEGAVTKGDMFYVEVADILPQDFDEAVTVTVGGLTVSYSPMNYIVRMSVKGTDSLKALLQAMYNYHLSAKNYA